MRESVVTAPLHYKCSCGTGFIGFYSVDNAFELCDPRIDLSILL